ncbi:hypothetical protein FB451DRAFT_1180054 [Mycena latifolia]|nr:hypothetical protein FB451DRAFT_1180054 [Mycena latifolia]
MTYRSSRCCLPPTLKPTSQPELKSKAEANAQPRAQGKPTSKARAREPAEKPALALTEKSARSAAVAAPTGLRSTKSTRSPRVRGLRSAAAPEQAAEKPAGPTSKWLSSSVEAVHRVEHGSWFILVHPHRPTTWSSASYGSDHC